MDETPKRVLSTLMIMGAQSPERAISSIDLAGRLGIEKSSLEAEMEELRRGGYLKSFLREGASHVYLSGDGIIVASSTYS
jgi:DNA-binding IscR family transcriptional regulator